MRLLANRNTSNWSLRARLVLEHFGISFQEELVPRNEFDIVSARATEK